jgi:Mn2+/Fe2+ NRAMP family transporter
MLTVGVPWGPALVATLVPHLSFGAGQAMAVIAVFGTTISPYLFFCQAGWRSRNSGSATGGRCA